MKILLGEGPALSSLLGATGATMNSEATDATPENQSRSVISPALRRDDEMNNAGTAAAISTIPGRTCGCERRMCAGMRTLLQRWFGNWRARMECALPVSLSAPPAPRRPPAHFLLPALPPATSTRARVSESTARNNDQQRVFEIL